MVTSCFCHRYKIHFWHSLQIDKILDNEYLQLQEQVIEFTGCPELCFVEQALEALMIRRSRKEQNVSDI